MASVLTSPYNPKDTKDGGRWETSSVARPSSSSYDTAPTYTSVPQVPPPEIVVVGRAQGQEDVYANYDDPFSNASVSDAHGPYEPQSHSTNVDLARTPSQYTQKSISPSQYSSYPPPQPSSQYQYAPSSSYHGLLNPGIGGRVDRDLNGAHEEIGSPFHAEIRDSFRSDASLMPHKHHGDDGSILMKDAERGGIEGLQPLGKIICRSKGSF